MSSDNSSDSNEYNHKYSQPLQVHQICERLMAAYKNPKMRSRPMKVLTGQWQQYYKTRTQAVRAVTFDIAWYSKYDVEKTINVLRQYPIYRNWDGTDAQIRGFVSTAKIKQNGRYYGDK